MQYKLRINFQGILFLSCLSVLPFVSFNRGKNILKEEQIRVDPNVPKDEQDSLVNTIQWGDSVNKLNVTPNSVILTGMDEHRLVTVYRYKGESSHQVRKYSYSRFSKTYYSDEGDDYEHFMPGIDILYGFNLVNLAHYSLKTEKLNFLFDHPCIVKTVYYPSFIPDSLYKKPIFRNYFLISVYDEDTNGDTLINRKDLRRIYSFDASCNLKTRIIPGDYSVVRSQYDPRNDVMYLFAVQDANKNGTCEKNEPTHIFWISLKNPGPAKRLF